jgi:hypothetical protein
MTVSELIAALQAMIVRHGDLVVKIENEYGEELEIESIKLWGAGPPLEPRYVAISVSQIRA